MWVRKRIDIKYRHLTAGLWRCLVAPQREPLLTSIANTVLDGEAFVCLSIRSGFDLILQTADWPVGSEILMSGLTIPDMARIVEHHQYVAKGIDLDLRTLTPRISQIETLITSRTKAIVVAHLFGGLCEMEMLIKLARRHNLLIIEDCAQAYAGPDYHGHPEADVSMFSFGPIKTNTALGGGLFCIRDSQLQQTLQRAQREQPVQSQCAYAKRLLKYGVLKLLSTRVVFGGLYRLLRVVGRDHNSLTSQLARGFAGADFFRRIRHRPSAALLWLLNKRLLSDTGKPIEQRQELGEFFVTQLGTAARVVGSEMRRPTYWVLPIVADEPQPLVRHLWAHGFDATSHSSLMSLVEDDESTAGFFLRHVVFLPFDVDMPRAELARMAAVIRDFKPRSPRSCEKKALTPTIP